MATASPTDIWQAFEDTFARFRNDFEDILFPANWAKAFSFIPEIRVPVLDLEYREKEYLLKAEMPGFKKEDIEIEAQEDSIAITGGQDGNTMRKVNYTYAKNVPARHSTEESSCQSK